MVSEGQVIKVNLSGKYKKGFMIGSESSRDYENCTKRYADYIESDTKSQYNGCKEEDMSGQVTRIIPSPHPYVGLTSLSPSRPIRPGGYLPGG